MTDTTVTIANVPMSIAAAECVECTDANVSADLAGMRSGLLTRETLLALCLDGVETADDIAAWTEYVDAICAAA